MAQPIEISAVQVKEATFFAQVYQWMAAGLGVTALVSFILVHNESLFRMMMQMGMIIMIAQLVLVWFVMPRMMTMSKMAAVGVFFTYAAMNGGMFAYLYFKYTGGSIASTLAITAGTFVIFSVYGHTTKKDLTNIASLLLMALVGVIIASIVNIFMQSPMIYWITTYACVGISIGLIAYMTNRLKRMREEGEARGMDTGNMAVYGAFTLYIYVVFLLHKTLEDTHERVACSIRPTFVLGPVNTQPGEK